MLILAVNKLFSTMQFRRCISKAELAGQLGMSRETLRKRLKKIKGLNTGRRQLLYPWELKVIKREFESITHDHLPKNWKTNT